MSVFLNKYRIESHRKLGRDYGSPGKYFVTICTKDMEELFGEVRSNIMALNKNGCAIARIWQQIPKWYPHVQLDHWVIMPNHIHGIIVIKHNLITPNMNYTLTKNMHRKEWKPGCLGAIIRSFKSTSTKCLRRRLAPHFSWHTNYHDKIIYNEHMLYNIRSYILKNPSKWEMDSKNPKRNRFA